MFTITMLHHIIVVLHAVVSTHSNIAEQGSCSDYLSQRNVYTCKYTFSSNSALVLLLLCVRLMIVLDTYLYIDDVEVLSY